METQIEDQEPKIDQQVSVPGIPSQQVVPQPEIAQLGVTAGIQSRWSTARRVLFWLIVLSVILYGLPWILSKSGLLTREYIRLISVLLSWPVAIIVISLTFLRRFHLAIEVFLRNVTSAEFPWLKVQRSEIPPSPSQEATAKVEKELEKAVIEQTEPSKEETKKEVEKPQTPPEDRIEITKLRDALVATYEQSRYWRFNYLDLYFVPQTKQVLRWFHQANRPVSPQTYHMAWQPILKDPNHRDATLSVLVKTGMLVGEVNQYQISSDGVEFLQHIGLVPKPPSPWATLGALQGLSKPLPRRNKPESKKTEETKNP